MEYSTLEDFIIFSNYRDLDEYEKAQITMFLGQAARQISDYLGSDDWSIAANPELGIKGDDGSTAKDRQLHIVKRYFDNQQGYTSESFDGIAVSTDYSASDGIRLNDYDKQVLNRPRRPTSRITTIRINKNNGSVW